MKRRKYIIWTLVALFVFGVALPVGIAYAARPSVVDSAVVPALGDGISYPYQRSTFYDSTNDYNYCFFVENYYLKYNSSQYGEVWNDGWVVDDCAGANNFSLYYDGTLVHMVEVNGSVVGHTDLYYGAGTPNSTGQLETVPKDVQVVAQSTVACRIIEPMVMVDEDKSYVMVVWTQDCPLNPPITPRYQVFASVGTYNDSGYWEVSIEATDELTGLTNSRYISATMRYDDDDSVYIIHAENASAPTVKEDSWYLVGNNFNGTSGLFEDDQWIMDAVTPTDRLLYGFYYSTACLWAKPLIQEEAIHIVYTQDDDQSLSGIYLTNHDWNENDGETWGVHTKNITLPEVGSEQVPVLARLNDSALKYLGVDDTTPASAVMMHREFHPFTQTWSNASNLRTLDWTDIAPQVQMGWSATSPLGYDWLSIADENPILYYNWFGDQEAVEAGTLGAELLQIVLPLLMALLALIATLMAGIRLATEPKITIIVGMMSAALVGGIAFLVVQQIVGGL